MLVALLLITMSLRQDRPVAAGPVQQSKSQSIRLSPQSVPGVELVSVIPVSASLGIGSDIVDFTFRNATGKDILAFSFSRSESPDPKISEETFSRNFANSYEARSWAPGAVTVVRRTLEDYAPIRVVAVEFGDGRVIGEEGPVRTLREDRRRFAEGLREALSEVRTKLTKAGVDKEARKKATADLAAELAVRNAPLERRNKYPEADLVVGSVLRRLTYEVGAENALEVLATGLEKAVARNTFKQIERQ